MVSVAVRLLNRWLGNIDGKGREAGGGVEAEETQAAQATGAPLDAVKRLTADAVLFEAPGLQEPVVATVLARHDNGTADLGWFDGAGRRHTTKQVQGRDFKPYLVATDARGCQAFLAALQALGGAGACGADPQAAAAARRWLLAGPAASGRCPAGHSLQRHAGQGTRGEVSCDECGREELGATAACFFTCERCDYDRCSVCAARSAEASAGRSLLAAII